MGPPAAILALLAACASLAAAPPALPVATPRRGVWFCGDFETGGLQGWAWDIARPEAAVVVRKPVRGGRYAVRITLAPGDMAASKERAELKVGDKDVERLRGRQGREMWYGWSLLIPAEYVHPPGKQFQILGQWHHRPKEAAPPGVRSQVTGPPPLTVHLTSQNRRDLLMLIGHSSPKPPPRTLGIQPIRRGAWNDLVFHIKWSTGRDGFVEAWLNGRPWTQEKMYGPTLYHSSTSNYLRLGLYRAPGVPTTNYVYYDEIRIGDSYRAVAP